MITAMLKEQCKALRLGAVPRVYADVTFDSHEQYLTELFTAELQARKENRIRQVLKRAAFPQTKTLKDFDWQEISLPAKTSPDDLASLSFIDRKECLVCMGTVGSGKTHLVIALGIQACLAGKEVRFFRTADLANRLLEHNAQGHSRPIHTRIREM